ncbi:zf-CCHC domain-containing protein [Tanacetum coccineum]
MFTNSRVGDSGSRVWQGRKFLRALPTKWHPKVTAIEESKDLLTLPLDELIGNRKVYEVVLENDSEISKVKKEKYKSLALKARKVSSDEEISCSESDDEEYVMAVRDFKKLFRRRGKFVRQPHDDKKNSRKNKEDKKEKEDHRRFKCGDLNHFISDCHKHSYNDKKAFVVRCWSDSKDDSNKEEICLIEIDNNEVPSAREPASSIEQNGCLQKPQSYLIKLTFQANEIYTKDEKLKKYRRIGMKAVKEKEQLQKIVDSWKNSSKNLWKLVDSGMTSTSKVGLGYEIHSNNEVLSYEVEMNRTVFKCTEEDFLNKPLYSRFSKTDNFKGVPHPLTGDYTPKPQEEIDDSLYVYGEKGPQKPEINDSDDNSTEHSTCQSNNSEGSCGNPSEHSSESESKVQLIAVRQNVNSVRPNVNTGRANVNSVRQNVNSVKTNVNTGSFNINIVKAKQPVPTSNSNIFSHVRPQDHPIKNMEDRGIFDSGCSGHMTGNKDHLDDFEECKEGSVTFRGSKGYITGKGRIRVGNLDFDSMSFVKELGHFNLFLILQICDKQHKVLFTETECLVVPPDFKMPDEN